MTAIRHLLAQRRCVLLLCAAALLLKLLVPAGYMIAAGQGRLVLVACSGFGPVATMPAMNAAMPRHERPSEHGRADLPCAFAGLSAATLGAAGPLLLAALIAFVIATGFAPAVIPPLRRAPYLRPPLRGPPATF
ncbi:hypothetical protein [Sphingomonas sp. 8AM]|uniref:hypothetical protein n=1 Tax=Sphingomonas sp. 8AM TaxID=2653170 RepID=UPI0012F06A50|nr:hypothetical protein [Sphingomonas sp. 8AM]VXD02022.1 conserved hypothetical protein [Sphingomonas sp. 8AM]